MTPTISFDEDESESDREEILAILRNAIRDARDRTKTGNAETLEEEQVLINWFRTLGYLSGQYRKLQKDSDIEEMEDDLELLREATHHGVDK
jgi:hypothetical protein